MTPFEYLKLAKEEFESKGNLYLSVWVRTGCPFTTWKDLMIQEDADGNVNYHLKLDVRAIPEKGKANNEIYRYIADEFGVEKDQVKIITGITESRKILQVKK